MAGSEKTAPKTTGRASENKGATSPSQNRASRVVEMAALISAHVG